MKDRVRSSWERTLLVCRKCGKRNGGGFGPDGDERLAKVLACMAGGGKGRKARVGVVEVPCLKICPRQATVVVDAAAPGDWLIVKSGTDVAELVARLKLPAADRAY